MKNMSRYLMLSALTLAMPVVLGNSKYSKKTAKPAATKEAKHSYKEIHSEEEFSAEMAKNGTTVIKFHAPWCSFCKKMEPEFDKTAESLKGDANFISVNTDSPEMKDVARTFKVSGLPTTYIVTKKTGFLSAADLEKEVNKATGKVYGMKTTIVPAPEEMPAKTPAKKLGKKS